MEVRHRILQFSSSPKFGLLQKELDKLDTSYKVKSLGKGLDSIEFIISEDDPLFPRITTLIKKHDFYIQVGVHYSQDDIKNADWLYATVGEFQYPQPEDDYKEATYDTSNQCRRCGMEKNQNRPFRLKRDFKQKNSLFLGLHWVFDEIFVRPTIRNIFEKEDISGVEFIHPVQHKSGEELENVYQMTVQTISKPGLVTEGLSTVTCKANNEELWNHPNKDLPYCGRVKYHYPKRDWIQFRESVFESAPDIVKSNEYFGSAAGAQRLILMRNKVMKLVTDNNIRGLFFQPIKII